MAWYHPALFALDAERAHRLTIRMLGTWGRAGAPGGLSPRSFGPPVELAGLTFPNPVGLAAGVDKDAEAIAGFFALGFGSVEVGTLTPRPQAGNPKPRLFRLKEDRGVINRMGFNNGGLAGALPRIASANRAGVLGINVGANKDSDDRIADYAKGVSDASSVADYITINISSPNTPGLRDLQDPAVLRELLAECDTARVAGKVRRPLFLKIAPDLDREQIEAIVQTAIDSHVDALIVGNTTISRPDGLRSSGRTETGGLSGAPLKLLARDKLAEALAVAGDALPIVAVGGIDSADEAQRRLDMGARLVQLYSALVYQGPGLVRTILNGLHPR